MSPVSTQSGPSVPADPPPSIPGAGVFGLYLLLMSLGMLFAASVVGYLVIRATHQPWPPPGLPALPRSLWVSTVVILLSSWTMQGALKAVRANRVAALRRGLVATMVLGVCFLVLQGLAWWQILAQVQHSAGQYLNLFYVLTGLHAAHVVGGLIPMAVATRRAYAGAYSEYRHAGVRYTTIYWHFLAAVWCVLFVVVYLV